MLELGILSRESDSEENSLNWTIPWPGMMGNWSDWFTTLFVFVCNHTWFVNRGAELIITKHCVIIHTVCEYIKWKSDLMLYTSGHKQRKTYFSSVSNFPSPLSSLEN